LPTRRSSLNNRFLLSILALAGLFLLVLYPIYSPLVSRFSARDSYYSHGFLIPFVFLYLVWRKKDLLRSIPLKPASFGVYVFLAGMLMFLISTYLRINFTSYMAVPIMIVGMSLYLAGVKFTKELVFPIAFLMFMFPLPRVSVIGIPFKLKMWVVQVVTLIASKMGIAAKGVGSIIYYPGGYLLVGDPCSGLRSLVTFLALGALFAHLIKGSIIKKLTLFLLSIPLALISNLERVWFLLVVSYVYGEKIALGFLHELSGIMVFILGFIGLFLAAKLLRASLCMEKIPAPSIVSGNGNVNSVRDRLSEDDREENISNGTRRIKAKNYWVIVGILLLSSLFIFRVSMVKRKVAYTARLQKLPLNIGEWQGNNLGVSGSVYQILGTKDVLIRRYRDKAGDVVILAVVYSDNNRGSFHPPEYCYLGSGLKLLSKSRDEIDFKNGRVIHVNKLVMEHSQGIIKTWYWYVVGDKFTPSYYLQQEYIVADILKGHKAGGALIRVSVQGSQPGLEDKAKSFIEEAVPLLRKILWIH